MLAYRFLLADSCFPTLACRLLLADSCLSTLACRLLLADSCLPTLACRLLLFMRQPSCLLTCCCFLAFDHQVINLAVCFLAVCFLAFDHQVINLAACFDFLLGSCYLSCYLAAFWDIQLVLHDVNRTHVIHHLFPSLPHYHAIEARDAVKPMLGEYYKYDDTSIPKALWRDTKECIYVEQDENIETRGVYWFFK
ncbi:hypothetical protein Tco_1084979 [Tanacetum coccineum]